MILVGQYDSPFVRRAGVALHIHEIAIERQILSTFAHFEDVQALSPLGKVPVLIMEDGTALPDSRAIIEHLEARGPRLAAEDMPLMLQIEAVGIGLAEKTYERGIEVSRRAQGCQDPAWIARLEVQISAALLWLEQRAGDGYLREDQLTRADLAAAIAVTYLAEKLPALYRAEDHPRLEAHRRFCEDLAPFQAAAFSQTEARATGWQPEA